MTRWPGRRVTGDLIVAAGTSDVVDASVVALAGGLDTADVRDPNTSARPLVSNSGCTASSERVEHPPGNAVGRFPCREPPLDAR
jgi:hypothetical protein